MASQTDYHREVDELAELSIARRGERAAAYAKLQALKAACFGHERAVKAWHSIADTVEQVWRVERT